MVLLTLWHLTVPFTQAQRPDSRQAERGSLAETQDANVKEPMAEPSVYGSMGDPSYPSFTGSIDAAQPFGFGFTIRAGVIACSVGGGVFDDHLDRAGWTIEVVGQQPLLRGRRSLLFWEAGGLYMHNPGDDSVVVTSGTAVRQGESAVFFNNFQETRLKLFQRAGVQIGTGMTFYPGLLNSPCHQNTFMTLRGGLRFGHARGRFDQTPTSELQTFINRTPSNQQVRLFDDVDQSDQFFGLYTAIGAGTASFPIRSLGLPHGEIRLSGDVVYDYTWFNLGDYGRNDDGLGTLSALVTWTFLH